MSKAKDSFLIRNARIINEGVCLNGSVLISEGVIEDIFWGEALPSQTARCRTIDAGGQLLLPGLIDDHVHFREPGLTHKADIASESRAGVAGGVTSYMEMPNTIPQTTTLNLLEQKNDIASQKSAANYAFFLGASDQNLRDLIEADPAKVCGIKLFMGSSTGNMLVDDRKFLEELFANASVPVAVHCEDEDTIKRNIATFRAQYGDEVPTKCHPLIRSEEACYRSSALAVELAHKYNTRLHITHLSTARELTLLEKGTDIRKKRITGEVCVHHLWFNDSDYDRLGTLIKWNPAIKTENDRLALMEGLQNNTLDLVATDHAPHTLAEKQNSYFKAPSGGPLIQFSLQAMMEFYHQKQLTLEQIVTKMCHAPAELFQISKRGYIRKGYHADLVLVNPHLPYTVSKEHILSKCKWSPFEGYTFKSSVTHTWVNGNLVFCQGELLPAPAGDRITYDR